MDCVNCLMCGLTTTFCATYFQLSPFSSCWMVIHPTFTLTLFEWQATQHKVLVFALPPNTTHTFQPLDKDCFDPLKRPGSRFSLWVSHCQSWQKYNKIQHAPQKEVHDICISRDLSREHRDHHETGHIYSLWCLVVHGVQWPHCVNVATIMNESHAFDGTAWECHNDYKQATYISDGRP